MVNLGQRGIGFGEGGGAPFARLEAIENGTLVHYVVSKRWKMPRNALGFPPSVEGDTWKHDQAEPEMCGHEWKTVYCADTAALLKTVETAQKAYEDLARIYNETGGPGAMIGPGAA